MKPEYINPLLFRAPLSNEFMSFQMRLLPILHHSFSSVDLVETGTSYLQIIRLMARVRARQEFANLDELANFIGRDEASLDVAISSLVFRAQDVINSIRGAGSSDYSYNVMVFPLVSSREIPWQYREERILLDGMRSLHAKLIKKHESRSWEDYEVGADNSTEIYGYSFPDYSSDSSSDTTDLMSGKGYHQESDR